MGTIRLHIAPNRGVVAKNCQVHSVKNLFVARSIFLTGGANNSTLPIISLAIRLAVRVKKVMVSSSIATMNGQSLPTLEQYEKGLGL